MKTLKDRIWETRKTRILTCERLINYSIHSGILIPYYSIFIISITIIPKQINQSIINFASILGSIIVLVISLILSNQKYEKRANEIKTQYIKLQGLIFLLEDDDSKKHEVEKEYLELLDGTENQKSNDYLKLMIQLRKDKESTVKKPTVIDYIHYYGYLIISRLILLLVYIIPIVFIIYIVIK